MSVSDWVSDRRSSSGLKLQQISFDQSTEWFFDSGSLQHTGGSFFSIEGLKGSLFDQNIEQPIINQPEVGILGFLVVETADQYDWLLQAKCEPGNVGSVQIGPSVQATYSNYMCKHGGAATHYLSYFQQGDEGAMIGLLQSEQGTRFLRKFNKNATCLTETHIEPLTPNYRWFPAQELQKALRTDYLVNTDARSVIVSSSWRYIAKNSMPFSQDDSNEWPAPGLSSSYNQPVEANFLTDVMARLSEYREQAQHSAAFCPLEDLTGWEVSNKTILGSTSRAAIEIKHYWIEAPDREKPEWDQPLTLSTDVDSIVLLCTEVNGVLRFLFRPSFEIGLTGGCEIGPSYKKELEEYYPDWIKRQLVSGACREIVGSEQSDEGGRFMKSCCRYVILEAPSIVLEEESDGMDLWLSLSEIELLCQTPGILTNEARSVISLIVSYA